MANNYLATFNISVEGDTTGEKFPPSAFECKTALSFADHTYRDRVRRELLAGPDPSTADPRAASIAHVLSELACRLTKWPVWWTNPDGGVNGHHLLDDNVIGAVYDAAIKKMQEREAEVAARREAARAPARAEAQKLEAEKIAE